jgi:hypothetical protein
LASSFVPSPTFEHDPIGASFDIPEKTKTLQSSDLQGFCVVLILNLVIPLGHELRSIFSV